MDWDKLRTFRVVAHTGRLSLASEKLGISQSALSRQISALEYSLSTQLFHRHARGIILTEQGNILYKAVDEMGKQLEGATTKIRDNKQHAFGELRVTTTVGFGNLWLVPRLPKFFEIYPQLNINLMLDERILDLPMREADIAIRMKEPSQADLVRRKFMSSRLQLFASQEYIDQFGMPECPDDLIQSRLISQHFTVHESSAGAVFLKRFLKSANVTQMTINNYYGVLQCVRNNIGIGVLPDYLHEHYPDMLRILPNLESDEIPIYLAYPSELRDSRKIAVFKDFIIAQARMQQIHKEISLK